MTALLGAGILIAACGLLVELTGKTRRWLHLFQLEHYEPARLMTWWRTRSDIRRPLYLTAEALTAAGATAFTVTGHSVWAFALLALLGAASFASGYLEWRRTEKKPLVFTPRAKRLFLTSLTPGLLLLVAVLVVLAASAGSGVAVAALLGTGLAAVALAPVFLVAANAALSPLERRINRRFAQAAQAKLAAIAPITIGITGSYGKTTTKFCVGRVLSSSRDTLITPESFNSFLGVTRTVNEQLEPRHRAFVVEMGAYRRGDIRELCDLVKPTIGILTAIGPMHLERFGSIEAIRDTKAELLASLPADGHFITNGDDPHCRALAASAGVGVTFFALEADDAEVRASEIRISSGRTSFTLWLGPRSYPVEARLLGIHNVRNLLAAAACGLVAGVDDADIALALEAVEPPPHRLAAIVNESTGVVVIDDAYNSNPEGAASALEVLAAHDARRRLLVTPGMVELGSEQESANAEFGRRAAGICDLVLLVGATQTEPVKRGLLQGGLGSEQIIVLEDIDQATEQLAAAVRAGDVVLFENDLPDTYMRHGRPRARGRDSARLRPAGVPLRR